MIVRLELELKKEEVYDYDTNTSTMEWKLMRETEMMEQAVEIEYFGGLYIFTMKDANNNVHTCTGHSG